MPNSVVVEPQLQASYNVGVAASISRGGICSGDNLLTFGQRLRELQKALAEKVAINFTYLSKIENERLDFAQFPSEELICKLAAALRTDENELLILAKKVPRKIRERVLERPEVFAALANCDDETLDKLMSQIDG